MSIQLPDSARFYMQAALKPAQGSRFQPTGFPDLGAAEFQTPDGEKMVLVESAQSVANRLEEVCWDKANKDLVPCLSGLPFVRVVGPDGEYLTSSIEESHRLNSPYLLEDRDNGFFEELKTRLGGLERGRVDLQKLAEVLFEMDPNSLLHGIFLAKKELAGGRLRLPRVISGFIEAAAASPVTSGGVKMDGVDPGGKGFGGSANTGFGHVPFSRTEYTGKLVAYFAIDLAQIRSFRLGDAAEKLLFALALYKIQRFLRDGLRLRTACDLDVDQGAGGVTVTRPDGFQLPEIGALESMLPGLIKACEADFASPPVREVTFTEYKAAK